MKTFKKVVRNGLTGALLIMFAGIFMACSDADPTAPPEPQQSGEPTCILINGVWYCT